jgi:hypothetical protein
MEFAFHYLISSRLEEVEDLGRGKHGAVFFVQVSERKGMHLGSGPELAIPIQAGKGVASIGGQIRFETEISRHADGSFDRIIRDDAADDESVVTGGAQSAFESSANEGAVGLLGDYGFPGLWGGKRLKFVAELMGTVGRLGFIGIMTNVVDWTPVFAPYFEQMANVCLSFETVAVAVLPPLGVVDGFLQIDKH